MRRTRFVVVLAVFITVLALQTCTVQAARFIGPWFRNYEGIEYAEGSDTSPRLMRAFALRISLKNPDVQTFVTPGNGSLPYETTRQTTPAFVTANNSFLKCAVNASFFDPALSPNTDIIGPLISDGTTVSPGGDWAAECLLFLYDKTPWLNYYGGTPTGWWSGVAGNCRMLIDGVANYGIPGEENAIHPRTAAGISQDGKYLILVVVDGRQTGWSEGAKFIELAQWCRDFGAWNAVNLDGGGSSCMALRNVYTGATQTMNRPSDGSPRAVGSNLGIGSVSCGTVGPSVCSMNSNRIDMVLRRNQSRVYLKTWTTSGGWTYPGYIGSMTTPDTPAIVSRVDGILDVFARGYDNALWHAHYENNTWGSWVSYGGSLASGPSAYSMNSNNMEIAWRDASNQTYTLSWNNGVWTNENLGGTTYDRPAIVSRGNGTRNVFIRGTDNAMWYKYHDGSTWSAWVSLGGTMTSGPAACSRNTDNLDIVYRGSGDDLWYLTWTGPGGGSWSYGYWVSSLAGTPAICSLRGSNTSSVYMRGTDDIQYHCAWNGGWTAIYNQGAYYY